MATYTAKLVAEKLSITIPTLHYYEKAGLLPTIARDNNNTRQYTRENIQWLEMIVMMRNVGVPIAEIRQYCTLLLNSSETIITRKTVVSAYRKKLECQKQQIEECLIWLQKKELFYMESLNNEQSFSSFYEESLAFRSFVADD